MIHMRNIFLNPDLLYLVDTQKVEFNESVNDFRLSLQRKNVAVLEVSNHFFELEKVKGYGVYLGTELPIRESDKEFIDITMAFRKFPYGKDFDFKNANLKSLRSEYRKYQIMELEDPSGLGIQKLYRGKVFMRDTDRPREPMLALIMKPISIVTFFVQLESGRIMHLVDFLEGKHLDSKVPSLNGKNSYLKVELEEEIPLKEIKDISIPYLQGQKKKCLQFPKSNI